MKKVDKQNLEKLRKFELKYGTNLKSISQNSKNNSPKSHRGK